MKYDYVCRNEECSQYRKPFERRFPLGKNPAVVPCPECGEEAVRAFVVIPPIQYRGTGWAGRGHGVSEAC